MSGADLPRYDVDRVREALERPRSGSHRVAGIVLAGGTSSRFGDANKLLAELEGAPIARHAVETLLEADLDEVVVVLGYEAEAVRNVVSDLDVRIVRNPDYEAGLSTSLERGVRAIADADAGVFLPGDMPAVDPRSVELLVDAYRAGLGTALAVAFEGRRGNPVLFDRAHFDELRTVDGDTGGRSVLLHSENGGLVETGDPGVRWDIDTRGDIARKRSETSGS